MTLYSALTYKEPTAEQVALGAPLARLIKTHHSKAKSHLHHLCIIAYGLRRHNLITKKDGRGGNAKNKVYRPEFDAWYKKYEMDTIYGKLPNFTGYAMAGRLLHYVRWQVGEKYLNQLPSSMIALRACASILWKNGDDASQEEKDYFKRLLIERTGDGSGVHLTRINTHTTAKEIEELRKVFDSKSDALSMQAAVSSIPLSEYKHVVCQIKASKQLFEFTKTGTKRGLLTLQQVENLVNELREVIARHNENSARFLLTDQLDAISKTYRDKKDTNFAAKIATNGSASQAAVTEAPQSK